jgi:hypothetical protein
VSDYTELKLTPLLKTALIGLAGYASLSFTPSITFFRSNYALPQRSQFSPLAARSLGAWFFLCTCLRFGAWYFWAEKGWYDTGMLSLGVPLIHYTIEKVVWGSVTGKQVALAYAIDGVGLVWMAVERGGIVGM